MDRAPLRDDAAGPVGEHEAYAQRSGPAAADAGPVGLRPDHARLLELQRYAGNRAVTALLRGASGEPPAPAGPQVPAGTGDPLPDAHRVPFEQALGQPLDHVRIHRGAEPDRAVRALGAEAFAVGADIYFANGSYQPGTSEGDRRLGHELTHVMQHDAGRVPRADPSSPDGLVSSPSDPLEREAYGRESQLARAVGEDGPAAGPVRVRTNPDTAGRVLPEPRGTLDPAWFC